MLPIMVTGVLLTGGVFQSGGSGSNPGAGTVHAILPALCYSGFLFLLRRGGSHGHVVQSYRVVVATTAVVSLAAGAVWQASPSHPAGPRLGGWR